MPGDFTWADFLAGFQEGGQAAISLVGVLAAVAVVAFCAAWFVLALCAAAARADRALEVAREREARAANGGAIPDFDIQVDDDWSDWPETTHRTHRRAS